MEALIASGSAKYEIRGRWFGPACGNSFYRWSEYIFGDFRGIGSDVAFFDDGRRRYWNLFGEIWRESGDDWRLAEPVDVVTESGWLHGHADPLPRFQHAIVWADSVEFEIVQHSGRTEFKTTDLPVLGVRIIREFYVTIDDSSDVITGYGWTQRRESSLCFNTIAARNGEYGAELSIPESLQ